MPNKYDAELRWWIEEATNVLLPWYREKRLAAWGHMLPKEKITWHPSDWMNAVATMAAVQMDYYPDRLRLDRTVNRGRLLDVGCGPMLPARHLAYDELWCLDPLLESYQKAGFPVRDAGAVLVPLAAENLWTIPADFFDTVVSVNALDHVDDFATTIAEIERVTKPSGTIRLELTYHTATPTEPIVLHDILVHGAFKAFPVEHIADWQDNQGLIYALWGNTNELT